MDFLHFNAASYGYGKSFHLHEVSFTLSRGRFSGIIGPNGSGKTTLLKGISGELLVGRNQIYLDGCDMSRMTGRERARKIACVTQFAESIDVTVEEYVLMGRIPYRRKMQVFETSEDFEIAEKYMKLTDVYSLRHKKFSKLSGGEQQLVSIAKALTQEPDLLLLDEPTSHLDIMHQVQMLNLIQELVQKLNLTVLMIIHDLNLASEYCDYLVLMSEGRVFDCGTPMEILNYKNIEEVYKTVVITETNPLSKKPAIFLVSGKVLNSRNV